MLSNSSIIFPVNPQYYRFMRIFDAVIEENEEKFLNLGVQLGDLGSQ